MVSLQRGCRSSRKNITTATPNAVVSDALRLLFLQPIRKDRRKIARMIYEIRADVQAAGGVPEKKIAQLVREYRQQKRAGK